MVNYYIQYQVKRFVQYIYIMPANFYNKWDSQTHSTSTWTHY